MSETTDKVLSSNLQIYSQGTKTNSPDHHTTEEFLAKPQKGWALGRQTPAKIMEEKKGINI